MATSKPSWPWLEAGFGLRLTNSNPYYQAVQDVMNYCDSVARKNLSRKFSHSSSTQSKSDGYLAHYSLAVEAVEAIKSDGVQKKKRKNKQ